MRILLINHYAGSVEHGMEYRPFYLAREWVRLGHEVVVVAASFTHLRSRAPRLVGTWTSENIEGVRYVWVRTPSYRGNGLRRVLNMVVFIGRLLMDAGRIGENFCPRVTIASSTYPLDIVPAYRITKNSGGKLVFEVHDLWPLTAVELGGMSPRHPFIRVLQRAEDFAYRKADGVVSLLAGAKGYMVERGMSPEKFAYIPNGIDPSEWEAGGGGIPDQHGEVLSRLKNESRFIVGYTGGHGVSNALSYFVEAAVHLVGFRVTLVLVGHGPEKDALIRRARDLGLANVVFLSPVRKTSIPSLLAEMDALYLGWQRKPIYRYGISPNKILDYMMAGKVIVHANAATNDPVAECGCGISVPPEDSRGIAAAIRELMKCSREERERMGRRGRQHVLLHHDYRKLAVDFLKVVGE